MAVKIRLTRMGKKRQPSYRVVVMDSRKPRDGEYIEQIGFYDPRQHPSVVEIDNERAVRWLANGAQPTERARKLLEISGAWTQFRVARGDIHTVGEKEAPAPAPVAAEEAPTAAAEAPAETPAETSEAAAVETPMADASAAGDGDEGQAEDDGER